ncbi:MAG TPA: hypothetical protein VFA84_04670 [Acidimicrobiales bacterium]|nr:hypothetical protein [Acidimicrobiales bacterium]
MTARRVGVVALAAVAVLSSADFSASWWNPGCAPGGGPPPASGPVNSTARIAYGMDGPHEALVSGVPASWSWGSHPTVDDPVDALHYGAVAGWGQVYAQAGAGEPAQGSVRVELKNMQLYVWSKSGHQWQQVQASARPDGSHYAESFSSNASSGTDWRAEPDGGTSSSMVSGFNLHFWPGARGTVSPGDVGGVYVTFQARLIGPAAGSAKYLANAGADWWASTSASYPQNAGVGEGRFMFLSPAWQAFDFWTGGPYGPASSPPSWNVFGLDISRAPIDAMGRP